MCKVNFTGRFTFEQKQNHYSMESKSQNLSKIVKILLKLLNFLRLRVLGGGIVFKWLGFML